MNPIRIKKERLHNNDWGISLPLSFAETIIGNIRNWNSIAHGPISELTHSSWFYTTCTFLAAYMKGKVSHTTGHLISMALKFSTLRIAHQATHGDAVFGPWRDYQSTVIAHKRPQRLCTDRVIENYPQFWRVHFRENSRILDLQSNLWRNNIAQEESHGHPSVVLDENSLTFELLPMGVRVRKKPQHHLYNLQQPALLKRKPPLHRQAASGPHIGVFA